MFDDVSTAKNNQDQVNDEPIVTMPGMGQPVPPNSENKGNANVSMPNNATVSPNIPDNNPAFPPVGGVEHKSNVLLYVLIAVLVVIVLGVGGYIAYNYFMTPPVDEELLPINNMINENPAPINQVPEEPQLPINEPEEIPGAVINLPPTDTDADGLTDQEEIILGTSINLADTDRDGLNDFDEVRVYLTDPNNPDTDGDSFLDGEEVTHGYDPKGPGKLLNLQIE